jgi:hypothetical protein
MINIDEVANYWIEKVHKEEGVSEDYIRTLALQVSEQAAKFQREGWKQSNYNQLKSLVFQGIVKKFKNS